MAGPTGDMGGGLGGGGRVYSVQPHNVDRVRGVTVLYLPLFFLLFFFFKFLSLIPRREPICKSIFNYKEFLLANQHDSFFIFCFKFSCVFLLDPFANWASCVKNVEHEFVKHTIHMTHLIPCVYKEENLK